MKIFDWPLEGTMGENKPYIKAYLLDRMPMEQELLPAVLICPGGGYTHLSPREAEPIALAFAAKGYQTFILHYSILPRQYPQPMLDAAKALKTIREYGAQWHVDGKRIAMCGFSAGSHLTAVMSTLADSPILREAGYEEEMVRPNAAILCYGVASVLYMSPEDEERLSQGWLGDAEGNLELQKVLRLNENVTAKNPPTFL